MGTFGQAALLGLVLLLGACARNPAPVVGATDDTPEPAVATTGVTVHLVWTAPVDLDLYVTVPGDETVYYGNRGAAFRGDVRCDNAAPDGGGVETVRWTNPAAGRYRIGVDFPERCAGSGDVAYRLLIDVAGRRTRVDETATLLQRAPNVEEFHVP